MTQITVLPRPGELPDFQSALADLERVPEILYQGLEYGAYKTSAFRDSEFPQKRLEACLSASIFRAHAIDFLNREGLDAQEDGCHWKFNKLPFLGISFYYNGLHVRILKGPNAVMPGCGYSRKKKKFYDQFQTNYLIGNKPMRSRANLIVLWDFDAGYTLAQLWLALPASGGAKPQDVSAYWCNPLSHPAEQTVIPPQQPPTPDDGMDQLIKSKVDVAKDAEKEQSGAR